MKDKNSSKKRKRIVVATKYPLPNPYAKFEQHIEIIKAYASLSKNGEKPLYWKDFEGVVDFNPQYVSGNNNFLMSLGLIKEIEGKRGYYVPTNLGVKLAKAFMWGDEHEAKNILRNILSKS